MSLIELKLFGITDMSWAKISIYYGLLIIALVFIVLIMYFKNKK